MFTPSVLTSCGEIYSWVWFEISLLSPVTLTVCSCDSPSDNKAGVVTFWSFVDTHELASVAELRCTILTHKPTFPPATCNVWFRGSPNNLHRDREAVGRMSGWNEGGRSDKEEDERVINFFIFFIQFFIIFFYRPITRGCRSPGADQMEIFSRPLLQLVVVGT